VLTAIDEGRMLFAIDQQQYLQGYQGVTIMTLFVQYGLLLGGGDVVRTGPGFVTADTAAQVIELSAEGIR
jgi:simple sugar transport system substrate-binding protein